MLSSIKSSDQMISLTFDGYVENQGEGEDRVRMRVKGTMGTHIC